MTTWTGTVPTIASGDTATVPTNLATYRDILKALTEAWTAFVPTPQNFAYGNGVMTARYARLGKLVFVRYHFAAGSTTTWGAGQSIVTLPAAAHTTGVQHIIGRGSLTIIGNAIMWGTIQPTSSSNLNLEVTPASNNSTLVGMSSTSPNPGTTGYMLFEGMYETA